MAVEPRFVDVARQTGIDFVFFNDPVPDRFFILEVMGGGAAWFDADRDGWLDLYLMNGREMREGDQPIETTHSDQFFRNHDGSFFQQVTERAHAGESSYGQGCAAGDFDADGFPDLYLTSYGENVLLHNLGDGTFKPVSQEAGVGDPLWSTAALWVDVDADADLDLYVTNYLDVSLSTSQVCTYANGYRGYCGPGQYHGLPDHLYLNLGDGRFREASRELGLDTTEGKGLAAIAVDFNQDLQPEIYVANDMWANFLFTRRAAGEAEGGPLYREVAAAAGCAFAANGENEASMGACCEDFDGDGFVDIFLTHYYQAKNTLYRNLGSTGDLLFQDDSGRSRIASTSYDTLGFGTTAIDFDYDGDLDLFVANGHVLGPNFEPNEMLPQLLGNDGAGRFVDISRLAGPYFQEKLLGRSTAGADYDNDGDLDILVTHLDRPVGLLKNDTARVNHFIGLRLATPTRVPPVGGRVTVSAGERRWTRPIATGGSYLSTSDDRLLFGLGPQDGAVDVEIYWPSGRVERFADLEVDAYWSILEGGRPRREGPQDRL